METPTGGKGEADLEDERVQPKEESSDESSSQDEFQVEAGDLIEEVILGPCEEESIPMAQSFWSFSLFWKKGALTKAHHPEEWKEADLKRHWRQFEEERRVQVKTCPRACRYCRRRKAPHHCVFKLEPILSGGGKKGKGEGSADMRDEDLIGPAIRNVRLYQVDAPTS